MRQSNLDENKDNKYLSDKVLEVYGKTLAYRLLQKNEIEAFRCGREYRILKSKVIEYLKRQ